eukprot:Tamp_10163.p1 GENE.Tamp_10163~~Tamp_10163.p1  ORF type:complete len:600 (+),score=69.85 Tamp_10163:3-1802(+)
MRRWRWSLPAAVAALLLVLSASHLASVDGKGGGGSSSSSSSSSSSYSSGSYSSSPSSYSSGSYSSGSYSSGSYSSGSKSSSSSTKTSTGSSTSSSSSGSYVNPAQQSAIKTAGGTARKPWGATGSTTGASGSRWKFGGSTTRRGSTLYRGSNNQAYSSRPRYYGNGAHLSKTYSAMTYAKRAVLWGAVAGAGAFAFYAYSSSRLDCPNGYFLYGFGCRSCSDAECPIGQYRTQCTPWTDSYCRPCRNKPSGSTYSYTTPGNCCLFQCEGSCGGGCEFDSSAPYAASENDVAFPASDSAVLQIIFEVPTDKVSFNGRSGDFRSALATLAGVGSDNVKVMAIEEEPIVDIRLSCDPCPTYKRIPKAATDNKQYDCGVDSLTYIDKNGYGCDDWKNYDCTDVSIGYGILELGEIRIQCPTACRSCCLLSECTATAMSSSVAATSCVADCGSPCQEDKATCGYYRWNECGCSTRRAGERQLLSTAAATNSSNTTNTTSGCVSLSETMTKHVLVSVGVTTTIGKVDETWDLLNEYAVNQKMAASCLWPTVMTYDEVEAETSVEEILSSASIVRQDALGVWVSTIIGLACFALASNCFVLASHWH